MNDVAMLSQILPCMLYEFIIIRAKYYIKVAQTSSYLTGSQDRITYKTKMKKYIAGLALM